MQSKVSCGLALSCLREDREITTCLYLKPFGSVAYLNFVVLFWPFEIVKESVFTLEVHLFVRDQVKLRKSSLLDFLKVARSLLVEWTKQGARSRFALFELDLQASLVHCMPNVSASWTVLKMLLSRSSNRHLKGTQRRTTWQ